MWSFQRGYRRGLWPTDGEHHFWLTIAMLMAPLVLVNVLIPPLTNAISRPGWWLWLAIACFGWIGVQAAWLGIAQVFAPGPLWRRSLLAWAFGLLAMSAFASGFLWIPEEDAFERRHFSEFVLGPMCQIPLLVLASQTPLWLARLTRSWRCVHPRFAADSGNSLGDLFVLTFLAAAALGAAQLGKRLLLIEANVDDFWIPVGIGCGIFFLVGLLMLLPLVWVMLRWRQWFWAIGMSLAYPAVVLAAFYFLTRASPPPQGIYPAISVLLYSFSLGLLLSLSLLRLRGWRLSTTRQAPDAA